MWPTRTISEETILNSSLIPMNSIENRFSNIFIKGIPIVTVVIFANDDDAKLSESFIADDANQAVLELDTLLPFIKCKRAVF